MYFYEFIKRLVVEALKTKNIFVLFSKSSLLKNVLADFCNFTIHKHFNSFEYFRQPSGTCKSIVTGDFADICVPLGRHSNDN